MFPLVIFHPLTPPRFLAINPYLSFVVLGMEPSSILKSLFPYCNGPWIKCAFTTLSTVWLCFVLTHGRHGRKVHVEKIHLFSQKQLTRWYLLWKAMYPSGCWGRGSNKYHLDMESLWVDCQLNTLILRFLLLLTGNVLNLSLLHRENRPNNSIIAERCEDQVRWWLPSTVADTLPCSKDTSNDNHCY